MSDSVPTPESGSLWGFPADTGAQAHTFVPVLAANVSIEGDDGHHLGRVRRLTVGEAFTAADGAGRWRRYVVTDVSRGGLRGSAGSDDHVHEEPRPRPEISVAFAVTKGDKPQRVVSALTELGVDRIVPVRSARSVVRRDPGRAASAARRLRVVAREAACQSRRARLPEIADEIEWSELQAPDGATIVVAERGASRPPGGDTPIDPGPNGWFLLVGPEGGFAPGELADLGVTETLAVGPFVLRSATAAVAAASILVASRARLS